MLRCRQPVDTPLARSSDFVASDHGQGLAFAAISKKAGACKAFAIDSEACCDMIGVNHPAEQEKGHIA